MFFATLMIVTKKYIKFIIILVLLLFFVGSVFSYTQYRFNQNSCGQALIQLQFEEVKKQLFNHKWYFSDSIMSNLTINYTEAPILIKKAQAIGIKNYSVNQSFEAQGIWQEQIILPLQRQIATQPQIAVLSPCDNSIFYFVSSDSTPVQVEIHDLASIEHDMTTLRQQFAEPDLNLAVYQINRDFKVIRMTPDKKHLVIRLYQSENADPFSFTQSDVIAKSLFFGLVNEDLTTSPYTDNGNTINGGYFISDFETQRL